MLWHPVAPKCPDCDIYCDPTCTSLRADGRIAIEGKCPHCQQFMYIDFSLREVVDKCRQMDNPQSPLFDLASFQPKGRPN